IGVCRRTGSQRWLGRGRVLGQCQTTNTQANTQDQKTAHDFLSLCSGKRCPRAYEDTIFLRLTFRTWRQSEPGVRSRTPWVKSSAREPPVAAYTQRDPPSG